MSKEICLVVAMDRNRGIGMNGRLPWKLPGDMRFFRELTTGPDGRNAVLMGRKTWDSLPAVFKPLPNRLNGVLSRQDSPGEKGDHKIWNSLQAAVMQLQDDAGIDKIFVIGGAEIFGQALAMPECQRIYLTDIDAAFPCDVFFPGIPAGFEEVTASDPIEENGIRYRFRLLQRDIK